MAHLPLALLWAAELYVADDYVNASSMWLAAQLRCGLLVPYNGNHGSPDQGQKTGLDMRLVAG
ncbi:hypothetical protein BAUCODRAFT_122285 [Baudoinia panamericana UAMH 10762]|uniref:Uncharacterized protein n=1 Tax=Baudoinia panamericana (strain UAMH 10762) TaxID=717646 RepID=M2NAU3_BAUPA|nr:uncharacterized protein BAUCODRAFT_122285 [Baudoinia panamericana UAMH 10762]EMC96264.1 hypothetical protein BAUCODRAFT_122285 [Baudoinia panamericana UAMH 10762]